MLKWKPEYSAPATLDMSRYFHDLFWSDILQEMKDPYYKLNSNSALLSALRRGVIRYSGGKFTGEFNMKTSAELERFAKFDGRSKTWIGVPPPSISATASIANQKAKALNDKISSLIGEIPSKVSAAVDSLKYSIEKPLAQMSDQATDDLKSIGMSIEYNPELSRKISEDYTNNLNLDIKTWTPNQTERLREMVEKNVSSGYNRIELAELISNEYSVSMKKAKFLVRNETMLLTSTVRDERYQGSGIVKYDWSATGGKSGDGRTRTLHRMLHGRTFFYASPPIIDEATGERGNPGQTYQCRCGAKPVI